MSFLLRVTSDSFTRHVTTGADSLAAEIPQKILQIHVAKGSQQACV